MNKVKRIKGVEKRVKAILEQIEATRNSDSLLYLKVLTKYCEEKHIDIEKLTVPHLLLLGRDWGLPGFESVRRSRQKLQEKFPELSANSTVQEYRAENEVAFRKYARGGA